MYKFRSEPDLPALIMTQFFSEKTSTRIFPGAFRPNRAFSFTEIMISVLVVGVCLAPLFLLFSQGTAGTVRSRDEVLAFAMAMDLLDYARTLPYNDAFLAPGTNRRPEPAVAVAAGATTVSLDSGDGTKFKRMISIEEKSVPSSPFIYKIVVAEVEWDALAGSGNTRALTMSTLVFGKIP